MNRRHRTGFSVGIIIIALFALVGAALYLRGRAAPQAARLLPEANTVLYLNLKPIRLLTGLGGKELVHDPEYQDFVRRTGIQFERDLDEAAFAVYSPPSQDGGVPGATGLDRDPSRYSEIFVGRFDSERLNVYLKKLAASVERYREHEIYNIPRENRTVRVSILSSDLVAASNTDDRRQIYHMIEQFEKSALPFGGPELVRDFYSQVPFAALAWLISDVPLRSPDSNNAGPAQIVSRLLGGGITVASLRYSNAVHLRVDTFASREKADQLSEELSAMLSIYRSIENANPSAVSDPELKTALDSIKVEKGKDRVTLTAALAPKVLTKIFAGAAVSDAAPAIAAPVEIDPKPKRSH